MTETIAPLRAFVAAMTQLVAGTDDEGAVVAATRPLLAALIADDGWLPSACRSPRTDRYAQYLLHADPLGRFSVVSFVWGPGQQTPVHNHTVWGVVGVLAGAERCEEFALVDGVPRPTGDAHVMTPGAIDAVSPAIGDWHRVSSASDGVSISIHVYGADIGAVRRQCLGADGQLREFVSGYDGAPALPL